MSTGDLEGEVEAEAIARDNSSGSLRPARFAGSVFRHKSFRTFFIVASISNGAAWMQLVAVPALLFDMTDSATWVGFSTLVNTMPSVLFTAWAGVIADRVSRKRMLITTQTVQMLASFALFALYVADMLSPWWIIVIGFMNGVATGFGAPTWQAFVPSLVPEEDMLDAVRLNSVQFTLARFIGPALAGVVISAFGPGAAIFGNASTFILVIVVLAVVNTRPGSTASREFTVMTALKNGARYMWRHSPMRLAVIMAFISSCFGQAVQFISAAVAARIFERPSTDNAGLMMSLGLGSVLASIVSARYGKRLKRSVAVRQALVFYVLSSVLIAATSSYLLGLIGFFLGGMAHLLMAVALNTLIQGTVPDRVRGRAVSFYLLGVLAGIPVGSFALGAFGDLVSLRIGLYVYAVVFVIVHVVLHFKNLFPLFDVEKLDD